MQVGIGESGGKEAQGKEIAFGEKCLQRGERRHTTQTWSEERRRI